MLSIFMQRYLSQFTWKNYILYALLYPAQESCEKIEIFTPELLSELSPHSDREIERLNAASMERISIFQGNFDSCLDT